MEGGDNNPEANRRYAQELAEKEKAKKRSKVPAKRSFKKSKAAREQAAKEALQLEGELLYERGLWLKGKMDKDALKKAREESAKRKEKKKEKPEKKKKSKVPAKRKGKKGGQASIMVQDLETGKDKRIRKPKKARKERIAWSKLKKADLIRMAEEKELQIEYKKLTVLQLKQALGYVKRQLTDKQRAGIEKAKRTRAAKKAAGK